MKVRQGFVSNSSSASFVVLGAKVVHPEDFDQWSDHDQDQWLDKHTSLDDDTYLGGIRLAASDECGLEATTISWVDLEKKCREASEQFGVPIEEISLHMGTRSC